MSQPKKLLVLGSGTSTCDVVRLAQKSGYFVIVTSNNPNGPANEIANKSISISVTDTESLVDYISKNDISGVFTGPSEFHLQNVMRLSELVNLPFYTTEEIWNICSDKKQFKNLCLKYQVPFVPEYKLTDQFNSSDLDKIEYPIIVKPVDSSSSIGVTVCYNENELRCAYKHALDYSKKKQVIIEKYIENNGIVTNVRYTANEGDITLSLLGDTFVVDPVNKTALITAVTVFPSLYTKQYIEQINDNVINMFRSIGVENGSFFMQSLPYNNSILFHEMGMRLSGGLIYKITEPLNGLNDLEMMIRFAMEGKMLPENEMIQADPYLKNKIAIDFCIPLKEGTIKEISGLNEIKLINEIIDFTQYYYTGDSIKREYIGTIQQQFCRLKFIASDLEAALKIIDKIQDTISIKNTLNENMIYMKFDVNRIRKFKEQHEINS